MKPRWARRIPILLIAALTVMVLAAPAMAYPSKEHGQTPSPMPTPGPAADVRADVETALVVREDGAWSGVVRRESTASPYVHPDAAQLGGEGLSNLAETVLGAAVGIGGAHGAVLVELRGVVYAGEVFALSLESNLSTGYVWSVAGMDGGLVQEGDIESRHSSGLLGSAGVQTVRLRARESGQGAVRLLYRRPWRAEETLSHALTVRGDGVSLSMLCSELTRVALARTLTASPGPEVTNAGVSLSEAGGIEPATDAAALPAAYNWCTAHGGCPAVRDQGQCGSCWAFATVAPLEAWVRYAGGVTNVNLSEQYLVSCNVDGWNCTVGGWYAHKYHLNVYSPPETEAGAVLESAFPYQANDVACGGPYGHPYRIASWQYVGTSSSVAATSAIKQAIYDRGPVPASVCVGPQFSNYSGGVFATDERGVCDIQDSSTNHGIVLVGWDDAQGVWILRNSWGPEWGESGYMRITYGTSRVGYAANSIVYANPTPPAAPTGLTATPAGQVQITLNWVDNASNEEGFRIERSPGGANTWTQIGTVGPNVTTYASGGLTCNTQYDHRVRAYNGAGSSAYSNVAPATTGACAPLTARQYLPTVYRRHPVIPDGVLNGSFESGAAHWTQYSSHGWALIMNSGFPGSVAPRTGSWAAWLGGDDDEIAYVRQQVSVPPGAPYLTYWYWIASSDSCGYDFGGVLVNDATVVDVYELCSATNTGGWVKRTVDLSGYAGQSISFQIRVETNGSLNSNLFVDDVSFQASAAAAGDLDGAQRTSPDAA
ncbi:MAG: hypothetical protein GX620_05870 [Chloroflexi bacterium]|nr:hypothetical protein [Chloroflexota bacterium]